VHVSWIEQQEEPHSHARSRCYFAKPCGLAVTPQVRAVDFVTFQQQATPFVLVQSNERPHDDRSPIISSQFDDADLITASRSGDRDAFGQIVRRYQGMIAGLIYASVAMCIAAKT
jgi:hypothetical protein